MIEYWVWGAIARARAFVVRGLAGGSVLGGIIRGVVMQAALMRRRQPLWTIPLGAPRSGAKRQFFGLEGLCAGNCSVRTLADVCCQRGGAGLCDLTAWCALTANRSVGVRTRSGNCPHTIRLSFDFRGARGSLGGGAYDTCGRGNTWGWQVLLLA